MLTESRAIWSLQTGFGEKLTVERWINVSACLIVIPDNLGLNFCLQKSHLDSATCPGVSVLPPQGSFCSPVENQPWDYSGIPGFLVHPRVSQRQQEEGCGFCTGSISSPEEDTKVETSSRCVQWTVVLGFTCIFSLCYVSACEWDRLTCFLINARRLFRRKSFHIMQWNR